MSFHKTQLLHLLLTLISILFIHSCQDSSNTSTFSEFKPVKIGVLIPYDISIAQGLENSTRLAALHLEQAGYPIQLFFIDSRRNSDVIQTVFQRVEQDKIQIIVGGNTSALAISVTEQISVPYQIPQIAYAASSPLITDLTADIGQDLLFRIMPSDTLQGLVLARLAYHDKRYRKVAILYVDDAYGQGLAEVFTTHFQALGGTVTAAISHDPQRVSSSYLAELQQAVVGEPEAIVAISFTRHVKVYIKEAIDYKIITRFILTDSNQSMELIEAIGSEALEGFCGTAPSSPVTESLEIFEQSYQNEYDELPGSKFFANIYDAVVIAGLAAYSVQAMGDTVTPLAIRDHLRKVAAWPGTPIIAGSQSLTSALGYLRQGEMINYMGVSGDIDFDDKGDVVAAIGIWCYQQGQIVMRQVLEQPCLLCNKK